MPGKGNKAGAHTVCVRKAGAPVPSAEAQQSRLPVETQKLAGNVTWATSWRVTAQLILGSVGTWQQLCSLATAIVTCTPAFYAPTTVGRGVGLSNCHDEKAPGDLDGR